MIICAFLALLASVVICLASLRSKRGDAVGLPLVAIGTFVFLYAVQPLILLQNGDGQVFFTRGQIAWAVFLPAVMLPCFVWGWRRERHKFRRKGFRKARRPLSNPKGLWNFGFATAMVGLCLEVVFLHRSGGILHSFSQAHGGAMAWENNTAYLYDAPFWVLSGAAMMMYASSSFKAGAWRKAACLILLALLVGDALLMGSRGILFSTCGAVFAGRAIAARKAPTLRQAFIALAAMGFGVLMMLGYRGVLHLGGYAEQAPTFEQALKDSTMSGGPNGIEHDISGVEFLYHGAILSTVDQTQKYDLGLQWIYWIVLNPIPHLLWPNKHYPSTPGITKEDVQASTGLTIAPGSRAGIVAETYAEFGLGEGVFFYWFGILSKRLFVAALHHESLVAFCAYVMTYALSLNAFAQGFQAIFVPLGYSMIPVILYVVLSGIARRQAVAFARPLRHPGIVERGQIQLSS